MMYQVEFQVVDERTEIETNEPHLHSITFLNEFEIVDRAGRSIEVIRNEQVLVLSYPKEDKLEMRTLLKW